MKRNTRDLAALLMAWLLTAATYTQAQQTGSYGDMAGQATASPMARIEQPQSYGETVGRKIASSMANLTTSTLELPKNIIIANNQSNVVYGLAGGAMKGVIHTMGRMTVGILDLVTAPIPTKPIAYPLYIWDDFDTETTYGPIFRPQNNE